MMTIEQIHDKAVRAAGEILTLEGDLIDVLQLVIQARVWEKLGYSSLHDYGVRALKFSDDQAYRYLKVARTALEVPQLKAAIQKGSISFSNARRIAPVITPENQAEWLGKAAHLKTRQLESEIVKVRPQQKVREGLKPVAESLTEFRAAISPQLEAKLKRVLDLESQRQKSGARWSDALEALTELYLERNDPIRRARRNAGKSVGTCPKGERPIFAAAQHQVAVKDQAQCTFITHGKRCENRRFLHTHHKIPVALGGTSSPENLTTVCSTHHKFIHSQWVAKEPNSNPPRGTKPKENQVGPRHLTWVAPG
jgi:hypothetical protein